MRNRTRISSLDAFGLRDQRDRIYPTLEASDGSTLSLDFTSMGGALDSRFTFSRSSPATFINSSGLVQYADANLILQSESLATSPWAATNGASVADVSTTNPVGGSTATQLTSGGANNSVLQAPSLAANVPHTVRFWVRGGTSTQMQFGYFSGSFQTASNITVVGSGSVTGTGLMTITGLSTTTWTQVTFVLASPATAGGSLLLYPDTATFTSAKTNFVWGVQINPGTIASAYNRTTTSAYYAPRFDYDPTTLAPRGLLIEGGATNLLNRSEDFGATDWVLDNSGATNPVVTANHATSPDGNTTADRIQFNKTGGTFSRIRNTFTSLGTSGANYTFSVWMRTTSGTGSANVGLRIGAETTGGNYVVTGTWQRFERTVAVPSTDIISQIMLWDNISGNDETADVLVWGAQLETGSGASSYIPTGSSTVQRVADVCSITGTNFSSWFGNPTAFTLLFEGTVTADSGWRRFLNFSSGANSANTPSPPTPNFNIGYPGSGTSTSQNRPFMNAYITAPNNIDAYIPTPAAASSGVSFKLAVRCQSQLHRITRGVGKSTSDSTTGIPAGIANLYFSNTDGASHKSVRYARLKVWPFALPDSQMDDLAT